MGGGFPSIAAGLLLLMSLSAILVDPIELIAETFDDSLSEEQVLALEELPASAKVSGITGNSATEPWGWAVKAGGPGGYESGSGIAVDSSGNAYVTGDFRETATFGGTTLVSSGSNDTFITKLSSSGSWQWAVNVGGADDIGTAIAVDSSGNAYVTGSYREIATFGSISLESSGGRDIFIAKLSSSGTWQWAVKAGGPGDSDSANGIAVDSSGNAYVTGTFQETATFGSTSFSSSTESSDNRSTDIFITKLSSSGTWKWAVKAGGPGGSAGASGIAVDSSGNAYVTGGFEETATFGSTSLVSNGGYDLFIAKLSSSGTWQWVVKAGGPGGYDFGSGIAVDSSGNAYVTGAFQETATFGSTNLVSNGGYDTFITKLSSSGSWQWAVNVGDPDGSALGSGIAVDSSGNAYVTGIFAETATFGSTSLVSNGFYDLFIAKLSSSGNWQWAVNVGGPDGYAGASGIAVDSSGNAYVTGSFEETATFGSTSLVSNGGGEIFIAKLNLPNDSVSSSPWDIGAMLWGAIIALIVVIIVVLVVVAIKLRSGSDEKEDVPQQQISIPTDVPMNPPPKPSDQLRTNNGIEGGYEWLYYEGKNYYRVQGSISEWTELQR